MARLACSASVMSVALESSNMLTSALTFDPCQYFVLAETPILPKPVARQSLPRPFSHSSIDPGHGHLQQAGDFMNSEEMAFASAISPCGRVLWRGMQRVLEVFCW